MAVLDNAGRERIDQALKTWRQGDCAVGEHYFLFRVDADRPLTEDGAVAASDEVENAEAAVVGFMVATQTCDIVRRCGDRPFVEVSPPCRGRPSGAPRD